MSEVFNSGMGGYLCDSCRTLLWAGFTKRIFCYSIGIKDVVNYTKGDETKAFCSDICLSAWLNKGLCNDCKNKS